MKGTLLAFGCFAAGIALGLTQAVPAWLLRPELPALLLSLLILTVGIGLGAGEELRHIRTTFRPHMLLLPLCTIGGTLLFTAAGALLPGMRPAAECLAVGSGFGYYSLSSVLIAELYPATFGIQTAAELSAVALVANVVRELVALFCTPLFTRRFGSLAAISAAGINSMDVCLPRIVDSARSGSELIPLCICHGLVLEVSVPLLIRLFG